MALRNQPYLPLYVQDFMTDEKLIECSAQSTGVYIRIMCILHKSETYGKISLKQKDKQTDNQITNFALKLSKSMPYNIGIIESSLTELIEEGCLNIELDELFQKRMVKDNDVSIKRSVSGSIGGKKTQSFAKAKSKAKSKAKTEYEYEYDNEFVFVDVNYREVFKKWLLYKKQRKEKYKTETSLKQCYENLYEYSKGNVKVAESIINKSIGSNYAGFFEPKPNNNTKPEEKKFTRVRCVYDGNEQVMTKLEYDRGLEKCPELMKFIAYV